MEARRIFLAPGMFSGGEPFEALAGSLRKEGFSTHVGLTVTTNTKSPGNPTIADNVTKCREDITRCVDEAGAADVIVVMHSAAGHYCSGALKDLSVQQRKAVGKRGGVSHIVFIAAVIAEEGNASDLVCKDIVSQLPYPSILQLKLHLDA